MADKEAVQSCSSPLLDTGVAPNKQLHFVKYGSLCVFLLSTVAEQILNKKIIIAAAYPAALSTLTALVGLVAYPAIIACAYLLGKVTLEQLWLPFWKPLVIGLCFSLHHMLLNAGSVGVPGILILVLVKFVLPVSMFASMPSVTLGLRYRWNHWVGLVILFVGIMFTVESQLLQQLQMPGLGSKVYSMLLIVASTIPLAASFTFIEVSLVRHHKQLFTVALWMYVCLFQTVFSILLTPITNSLMPGKVKPPSSLGQTAQQMACYVMGAGSDASANCSDAMLFWYCGVMFALLVNLAMPLSTKYAGASLMWFVRAMAVPLGGILFASPYIMGAHATALNWREVMGLLVVTCGVLAFNYKEPEKRAAPQQKNVH
eukprot:TRINITY_DN54789_c0_g1_i1.p1 TRINITY_DN54789_c0_g1~~TRINITY_DN54789_c0_g1_i1.p1  ORF type:complete len:386 (-),score=39.51 TRINITY_DN54789_c0_g1_i1:68-1183(-)